MIDPMHYPDQDPTPNTHTTPWFKDPTLYLKPLTLDGPGRCVTRDHEFHTSNVLYYPPDTHTVILDICYHCGTARHHTHSTTLYTLIPETEAHTICANPQSTRSKSSQNDEDASLHPSTHPTPSTPGKTPPTPKEPPTNPSLHPPTNSNPLPPPPPIPLTQ